MTEEKIVIDRVEANALSHIDGRYYMVPCRVCFDSAHRSYALVVKYPKFSEENFY